MKERERRSCRLTEKTRERGRMKQKIISHTWEGENSHLVTIRRLQVTELLSRIGEQEQEQGHEQGELSLLEELEEELLKWTHGETRE